MDTGGADGGCPPAQAGETHAHQPFVRSRRHRAACTACPRCGGAKRRLVPTAAAREAAGLGGCFGARCTGPTSRRRQSHYRALGATATSPTDLTSSPTPSRQRPAPPHRPSLVRRSKLRSSMLASQASLSRPSPRPKRLWPRRCDARLETASRRSAAGVVEYSVVAGPGPSGGGGRPWRRSHEGLGVTRGRARRCLRARPSRPGRQGPRRRRGRALPMRSVARAR